MTFIFTIYGQESLRRNGVSLIVNERVQIAVFGCSLKNSRMISARFHVKSLNITVIHVYDPTTDAKKAKVDWFYEDLQHILELTPKKKRCHFHHRGLECKSRKSRDTWKTGKFGLGVQNEAGQRLRELCRENMKVIANIHFQQPKR